MLYHGVSLKGLPMTTIDSHSHLFQKETPPRRQEMHRGRTKILYDGPDFNSLVLYFTDNEGDGNDTVLNGRGVINNRISDHLLSRLQEIGINTHLIRRLNMREQLVRAAERIPFKVHIYNAANKDLSARFSLDVGTSLSRPLFEFSYKNQEQHVVGKEHICTFGWSNELELEDITTLAQRTNDFLYGYFSAVGLKLLSFNLEFGRVYLPESLEQFELLLIDEISPETCVFQDIKTSTIYDVRDSELSLAQRAEAYEFIAERLGLIKFPTPVTSTSSDI